MDKRFPLFVDLTEKPVVIVGGGNIALRRIEVLLQFGADITVIAPAAKELPEGVKRLRRGYMYGDLEGAFLVIAATDNRSVNRAVGQEACERDIPVSVADCQDECSFYFPAICLGDALVAGIVSDDGNHKRTVNAANAIREVLKNGDFL